MVDTSQPQIVYAGTTTGVYLSKDGGHSWQPIGRDSLSSTVASLVSSPVEPDVLYVGAEHGGLFRSTDGGQHWQPWGLEGTSVYAILTDHTGTIWLGTDQGIFRSP